MAGTPGKNKIETGFRIYFDDSGGTPRDLSGDLIPGSCQGGGYSLDQVEMTGVSNTIKSYLGGHGESNVTAQFYMNDLASTGAFTVMKDMVGQVGTLTLEYGSLGAAPDTGDPVWSGEYTLMAMPLSINGGKWVMNVEFSPASGAADPAWSTKA